MARNNHHSRVLPVVLVLFVFCFTSWAAAQEQLGRLPILSRSKQITGAASPDPLLANDDRRRVPCFNGFKETNAQTPWVWCYEHQGPTDFVRLHLQVRGFPEEDPAWYLLIKDENEQTVDRLTANSFRWSPGAQDGPSTADRWSERVLGKKVIVELHIVSRPRDLRLAVDRLNVSFFQPGREAITTGSNDMRDLLAAVTRDHRFYDYSRSIAIVRFIMADGSNRETNCTGFLLAQDLLMTNQHCISEPWQLETATATFGYESQAPASVPQDRIPFGGIEMQDGSLDFTILRLKWPAREIWRPAKIDTRPISENQQLVLIQHPSGQRKILSVMDCKVQAVSVLDRPRYAEDFYHLCDCVGGSSGAPVIDEATGRVVGLHHREIVRPLDQGMNLAVKIGPILTKIQTDQSLWNRIQGAVQ